MLAGYILDGAAGNGGLPMSLVTVSADILEIQLLNAS